MATGRSRRIAAGIVSAISCSIEPQPTTASISSISAGDDPRCRRAKVSSGRK